MAVTVTKKENAVYEIKTMAGYAKAKCIAFNPNAETINNLTKRKLAQEPTYHGVDKNGNAWVRCVFLIQLTESKYAGNIYSLDVFFSNAYVTRESDGKKLVQCIDKFGKTDWCDENQMNSQTLPEGSKMSTPFRAAYRGEKELKHIIKSFANAQATDPIGWKNSNADIFDGDLSELQSDVQDACIASGNELYFFFGLQKREYKDKDGNTRNAYDTVVNSNPAFILRAYNTPSEQNLAYATKAINSDYNKSRGLVYVVNPFDDVNVDNLFVQSTQQQTPASAPAQAQAPVQQPSAPKADELPF